MVTLQRHFTLFIHSLYHDIFSLHTEPVFQVIETSLEMLFLQYRPSVNQFFIPNDFHKARQIWQGERGTWDELRHGVLEQYDL